MTTKKPSAAPWLNMEQTWPRWMLDEGAAEVDAWAASPQDASDGQLGLAVQRECRLFLTRDGGGARLRLAVACALELARRGWTLSQMPWSDAHSSLFSSLGDVLESANPKAFSRLIAMGAVDFSQWPDRRFFQLREELGGRSAESFEEAGQSVAVEALMGKWQPSVASRLARVAKIAPTPRAEIERGALAGLAWAAREIAEYGQTIEGKREEALSALAASLSLPQGRVEQTRGACERALDFKMNTRPWIKAMMSAIEDDAPAPLRALLAVASRERPQALSSSLSGIAGDGRGLVEKAVGSGSHGCLLALLEAGVPTLADWSEAGFNLLERARKSAERGGPSSSEGFERLARAAWGEMMADGIEPQEAARMVQELAAMGASSGSAAQKAVGQALLLRLELAPSQWMGSAEPKSLGPRSRM